MRIKRFRLHESNLLRLYSNTNGEFHRIRCVNPIPDDAIVYRSGHDPSGYLWIIVSSASFDEVPEGHLIPELPSPMFESEP